MHPLTCTCHPPTSPPECCCCCWHRHTSATLSGQLDWISSRYRSRSPRSPADRTPGPPGPPRAEPAPQREARRPRCTPREARCCSAGPDLDPDPGGPPRSRSRSWCGGPRVGLAHGAAAVAAGAGAASAADERCGCGCIPAWAAQLLLPCAATAPALLQPARSTAGG